MSLIELSATSITASCSTPLIATSFQSYRNDGKFIPRHVSLTGDEKVI
jgi:hypothetical protein